jgi:tetratricopeptide (TPR) repeat protein
MRRIFLICIFLLLAAFLYAEELEVEYLFGTVEYKSEDNWLELDIGDNFPMDVAIRLEDDAILEFDYEATSITVNRPGTYDIQSLLTKHDELDEWGLSDVLGTKLNNIFNSTNEGQEASSMGVRAAEVEDSDPFDDLWMDDDFEEEEEDLLAAARENIRKGNFTTALDDLRNLENDITEWEEAEFYYLLGMAYLAGGKKAQAMQSLASSHPDRYQEYYGNYILIRGKLLIESLAYTEALLLFNTYLKYNPFGEEAQTMMFLSALCLVQTGDKAAAISRLEKAQKQGGDTGIGRAAGQWIAKLK